jgi:dTDP-4-amino-4,6-dideoxygalactose transaminase
VYASPLHLQPVFEPLGVTSLPVAEDVCARHVCLPVHNDMTDAEIDLVIDAVRAVAAQLRSTS